MKNEVQLRLLHVKDGENDLGKSLLAREKRESGSREEERWICGAREAETSADGDRKAGKTRKGVRSAMHDRQ